MSIQDTPTHPAHSHDDPLAGRMAGMKGNWRRSLVDRFPRLTSLLAAGLVLLLALLLSACTDAGVTDDQDAEQAADAPATATTAPGRCIPADPPATAPKLVMMSAGGPESPKSSMMRDTLRSYLPARVESVSFAGFNPASLADAAALVIYGDADIPDANAAIAAVDAAQKAEKTVIWIGPGAYSADGQLDVTLDDSGVAFDAAPRGAVISYNGSEITASGLTMAEAVVTSPSEPMTTVAEYSYRGRARPAISARSDFLHIGFDPLEGFVKTQGMAVAMDAVADMVAEHAPDPRVVFRLEDLNAYDYGDDDVVIPAVAQYLLDRGIFLHLGVIPEYISADGKIEGDAGDMPTVLQVIDRNPNSTMLVQHGWRHHRDDPRNAGLASGEAYEFYYDDDKKLGPDRAAALARERMTAGRELMTTHLAPVYAFEAPHYEMSASQERVAEEMYDVIMHAPLHQGPFINSVDLYWFTKRNATAYAPSSAGYVDMDDPRSVDRILDNLSTAKALMPDPVMVVYFHPYIWKSPAGKAELARLLNGIDALGYRYVSACESIINPDA